MESNLNELAKASRAVFAIVNAVGHLHPQASYTSMQTIKRALSFMGTQYSSAHIEEVLLLLQEHHIGTTVKDDYDQSGFSWNVLPCITSEMMREGVKSPNENTPLPIGIQHLPNLTAYPDPGTVHFFALRDDFVVRIELPEDFCEDDSKKLQLFLKSIEKDLTWPFDTTPFEDDEFIAEDEDEDRDEDELPILNWGESEDEELSMDGLE